MGATPSQVLHQSSLFDKIFTEKFEEHFVANGLGESHTFKNIDSLDFDLSLCELNIYYHDDSDEIMLTAKNSSPYFSCLQEDGTLKIQDDRPSSTKQNSMEDALTLSLYLPKKHLEEVSIDLDVGNLTIQQLDAEEIEIDCGVGDIYAEKLLCKDIELSNGVGEIVVDHLQSHDNAQLQTGTGTLTLALFEGSSLNAECGIGEIRVTASGSEKDYNYDIHSLTDTLQKDHDADQDISLQNALGDINLYFTEE